MTTTRTTTKKATSKKATIQSLQKEYGKRIKLSFKREIELYINEAEPQKYIQKALKGKLTDADYRELSKIGAFKNSKYPKLYWLCNVYIHFLTKAESTVKKMVKMGLY